MRFKPTVILTLALTLVFTSGLFIGSRQVFANETDQITVHNPLGTPPVIKLRPMAPRLDTLKGKTIYVVDDGYIGGDNLLYEMITWFRANYPDTKFVFRRKGGFAFEAIDHQLWNEINRNGDAMIIGMGH